MSEKVFVDGLIAKRNDNAPDYVLVNLSINWEEFERFMRDRPGKWRNVVIKRSKGGKLYAELDLWEPPSKASELARGYPESSQAQKRPTEAHRSSQRHSHGVSEAVDAFDDPSIPF